jgi:HAD superfamily hydrolase (TIGR01549 family)
MIDPHHIRWIFLDVGDTLLDERKSMTDWCRQVAQVLTRREHPTTASAVWAARQRAYAELAPDLLGRLLENLGIPSTHRDVYQHLRYEHALERPFAGATDVLRRLGSRFRLGVVANQAAGTEQRLCGHGWRRVFSVCVSSTEEGLRKPDPAIFQLALDRAGCRAEQAVMVGDRVDNDIAPAKALGMATIRVRQGLSAVQEPADESQQADITVASLTEIPPLFRC